MKEHKPAKREGTDPCDLLFLATATLRSEVFPDLSGEQRYAAAMSANAVDIARRALGGTIAHAQAELCAELLDVGLAKPREGQLDALARQLRTATVRSRRNARNDSGAHCGDTHIAQDVLSTARALQKYLRRELSVRNPKYVRTRIDPAAPEA